MKKLLKSEIYGSVNSTWMHSLLLKSKQMRAEPKNKKKNRKTKTQTPQ